MFRRSQRQPNRRGATRLILNLRWPRAVLELGIMFDDVTPQQKVLRQIWNSRGPNELLQIMAREPAARCRDIALELQKQSESCASFNQDLAERLAEMAGAVRRIHESIDRFAGIEGMADLLAFRKEFQLSWSGKFNRLLGAFWTDALRANDAARQVALRRAFIVLRDVYVAVYLIRTGVSQDLEQWNTQIEEHPLLCDPKFHDFLDERFQFGARNGDASAETFAQMSGYIRQICKAVGVISRLREALPSEETIPVRMPLSPEMAELWFLVSKKFSMTAAEIAQEIGNGDRTLEAGIESALRAAPDFENVSKEASDTFYTSAFLEHLLRVANGDFARQAIGYYRKLADEGNWDTAEERATYVLHYAKALLNHWRDLADPLGGLEDGTSLITNALPLLDPNVSPRLMRDLFFSRARLLENVGIWQPPAYESAAEDYARGLAVPRVRHELEARGAALTDYANTLTKIPNSETEENDRKIVDTYEEALANLSSKERTLSRGLALNSYAAYLNNRLHGDRAANQERSLAMAQEAIDLIERAMAEGKLDGDNQHVLRTVASAYLTKSNTIRKRNLGDEYDVYVAARDLLRTGLNRLRSAHDDQLRGIINLNIGDINVELYTITADPTHARDAVYAYEEAEALLAPYPLDFSHALLSRAMIVTDVPDCRTPEAVEESLEAVRRALATLATANDQMAYARGWFSLGELQLLRGQAGDYEEAFNSFSEAQAKFLESGNRVNAIAAARRSAAVRIQQFRLGEPIDRLEQAKQVLLRSTQWIDELWQQFESVEWRYMISDRFANVYAEIAWCQAILGAPPEDIAFTIARAKGRELSTHIREVQRSSQVGEALGQYLDQLRVESRIAEMARWRAQRQARPDIDLDDAMQAAQRTLDDIAFRRRVLFPRPSHDQGPASMALIDGFVKAHPTAIVCDITTCRWGTVVLLVGGNDAGGLSGVTVRVFPLEMATVLKWVQDWSTSYLGYITAAGNERIAARKQWADRTEKLLQVVGEQLMQPALADLKDEKLAIELVIVPGRLAGLPLHAARLSNGCSVVESVGSAVYAPNVGVLSSESDNSEPPRAALCVLSDPRADLPMAAAECASVASTLQEGGADVKLLAVVGDAVGADALARRGLTVPAGITVLHTAPTREEVSSQMSGCDHFFYSGHGVGSAGQSGLVLVDDNCFERLFAEDDVLAMPALRRRPLIVLSACETATGSQTSAELFDLTSSFLRIGARCVIGSLWLVTEDCAQAFTGGFYDAFRHGSTPSFSFAEAVRLLKKHREAHPAVGADSLRPDHPIYWAPFIAMRGL